MSWDPDIYHRFTAPRERPLADLVAALPPLTPRLVADLGCGTGNSTERLARRFPGARLVGVDNSASMLEKARARAFACEWIEAPLEAVRFPAPPDLILSNAALHWVGDHDALFPRLAGQLAQGGVLAIQMPDNFAAPSHVAIRQTAAEAPWAERLAGRAPERPVADGPAYHRLLAPLFETVEIWTTRYLHRLTGATPVLDWVSGTALVPLMEPLHTDERARFRAGLAERLERAYPREADGSVLFPFQRLFIVAAGRR